MYINMVMFATGGKIYHFCSCTANKTFKKKINNDGQHFHRKKTTNRASSLKSLNTRKLTMMVNISTQKKTTNWASNLKSLNTNKTIQHMSSVKMRGHMLVLLILVELITITV